MTTINKLEEYLTNLSSEGIALAFSGGVDSTLLLAVLSNLCQKKAFPLVALTMNTVLQNDKESLEARNLAESFSVKHQMFTFSPLSLPEVRHNLVTRCYHCKKAIFTTFIDYIHKNNLKYLLDGTNADDLNVYRPGRKALHELGVISPLAELGISKAEIRHMSAELGLPTASKPAAPCLATRFEYNTLLNEKLIEQVNKGENLIKNMFPDIPNIRLRVHNNLARIEVSKEQLNLAASKAQEISLALKKLGFDYVTLDLEGFRSGSFDLKFKGM